MTTKAKLEDDAYGLERISEVLRLLEALQRTLRETEDKALWLRLARDEDDELLRFQEVIIEIMTV